MAFEPNLDLVTTIDSIVFYVQRSRFPTMVAELVLDLVQPLWTVLHFVDNGSSFLSMAVEFILDLVTPL